VHVTLIHDHVGGRAGGGGGVRQMLELALGLERLGHDVTVACHDFEPGTEFAGASRTIDIRSVHTGAVRPLVGQRAVSERYWRGMPKVARLVPERTDVINAHEWPALHAGRLAARRLRMPWVWTRNDETMLERALIPGETTIAPPRITGRVAHFALGAPDWRDARSAARLVVLDGRNAGMAERIYRRPVDIVRSGPQRAFFDAPARDRARAELGMEPSAFTALGVGILFPHRRFEDLIEAAGRLGPELPLHVHIVGSDQFNPGYGDGLRRLADGHGVGERLQIYSDGVSDERLRLLYAACDVLVFPNERQTWGLAPLEAIASGSPAIVSRGAGVHEVLEGRPGVWLVPPRDPAAIAAALRELHGRGAPGLAETREWIRAALDNARYAEGMVEVFERALAQR
jgi:D-inositol-3-phosphate glycosyltransferase